MTLFEKYNGQRLLNRSGYKFCIYKNMKIYIEENLNLENYNKAGRKKWM